MRAKKFNFHIDLLEKRFGRLIVVEKPFCDNKSRYFAKTKCDCGNISIKNVTSIKSGATRSCGCLGKEMIGNLKKTHNMSLTNIYGIWAGMHKRCKNKKCNNYHNYGGRGIKVCERWSGKDGFINFYKDMGKRPSDKHSIDRINNDGNYEPDNCRWATRKEQAINTRCNKKLTIKGIEFNSITEAAKYFNMSRATLRRRIYVYKIKPDNAVDIKSPIRNWKNLSKEQYF